MNRVIHVRVGLIAATCLGTALVAGCVSHPPEGRSRCVPDFADEEGWQGGDAAYSISLPGGTAPERRTLWLFGDSFIQTSNAGANSDRRNSALVHNSIAISRCVNGTFTIDYAWNDSNDGTPQAFFRPSAENEFWWPLDGFLHHGKLFIAMLRVTAALPDGPLRLPFRLLGTSLIEVDNPTHPPAQWHWKAQPLSSGSKAIPGAATHLAGKNVLLFSYRNDPSGGRSRFLSRLPLSALRTFTQELEPAIQTLNQQGHWENGFNPDRARVLMPDRSTEMSVSFHPEFDPAHQWIAVYGAPIQVNNDGGGPARPSGQIYLRSAPGPEGPWSPRFPLARIPERTRPTDPDLACYAAKEHPGFEADHRLIISYVCNLFAVVEKDPLATLKKLQREMSIYRPRVLEVPVPEHLLTSKEPPPR